MKNRLLCVVFFLATTAHAAMPDSAMQLPQALKPLEQQSQAAHLAAMLLVRLPYKPLPLDDVMSKKIFDHYLKALDSDRLYFTKADLAQMAGFSTKLDDAILDGDLSIPFAIFNLYAQRMSERYAYARRLLKDGFDFAQKESFLYERKNKAWPDSRKELQDLWRKRVKNDWLQLKLSEENDASIIGTLDKRYESYQKKIGRISSEDVFEMFMNAYTTAIDPHSNYMGSRAADDFEISMRLSLSGIGAALAEKDDYTTIQGLTPGAPASLSAQLNIGDRIVGVGEGESAPMTDIRGWRLDDAVALIRGVADSLVRLAVLPADAGPDSEQKLVTLVRKKIALEDQSARKSVSIVIDGAKIRRIGVITLPSFYSDFEARQRGDEDFKSATRDVVRALDELKQEKVDGVLLDLRNNGGGSLIEAVELAGLFVGAGPIVQQRDASGEINVASASGSGSELAWDGPLAVLINRNSASASEIFTAAIQDYRRGLVIGAPSFGKGTVQSVINLDDLADNDKPLFGELKITTAQFFRINGGTTQRRGVKPDIFLPGISDPEDYGEASFANALPWVKIKPAAYSPTGDLKGLLRPLAIRHQIRVKKNKEFQNLQENLAELKRLSEKNIISLNENERRHERDALASRLKLREARVAPEEDGAQAGELADKKAKARDILLTEAVNILSDEVGLLSPRIELAASAKPASRRPRGKTKGLGPIADSGGP
jgi:carboxyl-terminal processing protease